MSKYIEELKDLIKPMSEKSPYDFKFHLTLSDFNCFRFANSMGTQNTSINSLSLSLVMAAPAKDGGHHMVSLSSTEFNPEELLDQALHSINESPVNKEFKGFCERGISYKDAVTWYEDTAALNSKKKAIALEEVRKTHPHTWLGGIWESEETKSVIGQSNGLFLNEKFTRFTFELKAEKNGRAVSIYRTGRDINHLKLQEECDRAFQMIEKPMEKAVLSDGKYRIVLGPEAVSEICFFVSLLGFGGRGHKQKSNFTSKKVGKHLFENDLITLTDNCYSPQTLTRKYDDYGYPRKPLTLLDGGLVCDIAHDQFTAENADEITGHGGNAMAMLMELKEGNCEVSKLYDADNVIQISRFHYPTIADRSKPEIKGSTKDGTYVFSSEDSCGKDCGTVEFFFNPVNILANTVALSRERFTIPQGSLSMSMAGANIVPWIAVDNVTVKNGKMYLLD